jgi:hypothetical protein
LGSGPPSFGLIDDKFSGPKAFCKSCAGPVLVSAGAGLLIGSIRRECLDHVVVFGERHLRYVLLSYMKYHNEIGTHLSLEKDAPVSRAVKLAGAILCRPDLGGLHHQYVRV